MILLDCLSIVEPGYHAPTATTQEPARAAVFVMPRCSSCRVRPSKGEVGDPAFTTCGDPACMLASRKRRALDSPGGSHNAQRKGDAVRTRVVCSEFIPPDDGRPVSIFDRPALPTLAHASAAEPCAHCLSRPPTGSGLCRRRRCREGAR